MCVFGYSAERVSVYVRVSIGILYVCASLTLSLSLCVQSEIFHVLCKSLSGRAFLATVFLVDW